SETPRCGGQNRRRGRPPPLQRAARRRLYLPRAIFLFTSIGLFDVLLQVFFLEIYLLADWHAGKPRPLVGEIQHLAYLIDEFRVRIVVPPAAGIAKFDEVPLPTLHQSQAGAGDTV